MADAISSLIIFPKKSLRLLGSMMRFPPTWLLPSSGIDDVACSLGSWTTFSITGVEEVEVEVVPLK